MIKTFSLNLVGNKGKIEFLNSIYSDCQEVSDFILNYIKINKEYRKSEVHKNTYFLLKQKYPDMNTKLFQQIRDKVLSSVKSKRLKNTKKIEVPIILDYQSFNLKFEDKYFNCFLRFFRINFPLEGKRIIEKLKTAKKIKRIELIPKNNGKYFKVFFNCEIEDVVIINNYYSQKLSGLCAFELSAHTEEEAIEEATKHYYNVLQVGDSAAYHKCKISKHSGS